MSSRLTPLHRIAIARAVSMAGTEAAFIALVALVYQTTGSGLWVAAVLGSWVGVEGLVAPIAGSFGDRFDRQLVMVAADLAAAVVFGTMAFVSSPGVLVGLAALAAAAEAPFPSASTGAIPNLVEPSRIAWANGTITATSTVGNLTGPLIGGGMVAIAGAQSVFVLNAVSFLVSAALVWKIKATFHDREAESSGSPGLMAGATFVWADPMLRRVGIALPILVMGVGGVLVSELPLAKSFGFGSVGYGLIVAAWSGGAILGSLVARRIADQADLAVLISAGLAGSAIALAVVGMSPWFGLVIAAMLGGGTANGLEKVAQDLLVQRSAPDDVRSRVAGTFQALEMTALGISLGLGGLAVEFWSIQTIYLTAAAFIGFASLIVFSGRFLASDARQAPQTLSS